MDVKTKQAKTVMLPIYRAGSLLLLPLAICLTFTFGCVTNVSPSLPEEVLKDENSCAEKTKISCGQLALTIGIEKQTFYANPSLEIEIIDLATGKPVTHRVGGVSTFYSTKTVSTLLSAGRSPWRWWWAIRNWRRLLRLMLRRLR
jgi:hypothetical protein